MYRIPCLAGALFATISHGQLLAAAKTMVLKDYFFPLVQGNVWTYRQSGFSNDALFENRVTVTDQNYSFSSPGGAKKSVELQYEYPIYGEHAAGDYFKEYYGKGSSYLIYGFEGFQSDKYSYGGFSPPLEFKEPFKVGQSITKKTVLSQGNGSKHATTLTVKFIGFEKIVVPAGVFDQCAHLQITLKSANAPTGFSEEWWAKGVGPVQEKQRGSDGKISYAKMTSFTKTLLALFDEHEQRLNGGVIKFRDSQGNIKNTVTLTLTNLGSKTLKNLSVDLSGSRFFSPDFPPIASPAKLKPRESTKIRLYFDGPGFPRSTAKLTITDDESAKVVVDLTN